MRLKLPSSPLSRAALAAALFAVPALQTQSVLAQSDTALLATPTVQITQPVTNDTLVTLKGNTHPLAKAQYDQGAASSSMASGRVQLLFKRSPAQAVALREYLGSLQDPHSGSYHKWLTPASYGASFGISNQDLETVETWLQSQGLTVEAVPASRNLISFSGTTGQIAQAFHTSIHSYVVNGVQHYSNTSDPQIPSALAPVIAGISPLNDFRAKGEHEVRARVQVQEQSGSLKPIAQAVGGAKPALTGNIEGGTFLYLTPSDVATAYDSPNSFNRNFNTSSPTRDGSGVNIGIANYSNLNTTDYANYRRLFLGESSPVAPTIVVDGTDPGVLTEGDGTEALVDTEFSAALAPKANIYLYTSASTLFQDGLQNAAIRAIEDNTVAVLSLSYSNCEAFLGQSGNLLFSELWEEAAAQGITVTVAAGDTGSASCDDGDAANTPASDGLTVSGIASTPYDIAVGGTDFDALLSGFTQYVSPTNNALYGSVIGPIPENPWNDSISNNPVGDYTTDTAAGYTDVGIILAAGGGGASSSGVCNVTDQNGYCISPGYPTPPFQSNVNVNGAAPAGVRYLPDVSLFAATGDQHPVAWGLCSDSVTDGASAGSFNVATGAGTATYTDCEPAADGSFYLVPLGGTSASTPAFAGMLSLVIESLGTSTRLGTANNVIYNLANSNYSGIFHDVTLGNNSVPCASGSLNCETSNDFLTGYNATTNYDLATGLGSVDVTQLVNAWPSANFTPTSTSFQVNGGTSPISIEHGTAVTLTSTVSPNTVTGIVSVTGLSGQGGAAVQEYIGLTNGTGSISANNLPGSGPTPYNIQAYFPGDVSHGPSTSNSIAVTVTPEPSNPFLQVAAVDPSSNSQISLASVPYGFATAAEVIPSNTNEATAGSHGAATGTVALLNNGVTYGTQTLNSTGIGEFDLNALAPGSYSFTASYGGDNSYSPSGPTAATPINIVKASTALAVQASSSSITASASVTVVVQLTTDSLGNAPTGAITLSGNGQTFTATPVAAATSTGTVALISTFTVPGATLAGGSNTLTASYSGDGNYNPAASATTSVTVTGGTSTSAGFALTGPTGGLTVANLGTAQTGTITITPTNGFTGTVNLSCAVQFSGTGAAPTCSIAPTINLAANTAATTTLTINTTALSSLVKPGTGEPGGTPARRLLAAGGGIALCSLLLWGMPARRRSWRSMLVALLAFGALGIIGCGGSSNSASSGTPTGTYTAIVTGTSGTVTTSTNVSVNVE